MQLLPTPRNETAWIAVLAIAMGFAWFASYPIVITQDTLTYIEYAAAIQSDGAEQHRYWRLPLFPLLLLVFDITDRNASVIPLLGFQAVLGIFAVLLFYFAARRIHHRVAFWLTVFYVLTCLPFLQVTAVMTEQIFLFGVSLLLFGCTAYFTDSRTSHAALAGVIAGYGVALVALTRPQGAYVPLIVGFLLVALSWRQCWRLLPGVIVATAVFLSTNHPAKKLQSHSLPSAQGTRTGVLSTDLSRTTGKMFFFNIYLTDFEESLVTPGNGEATQAIAEHLLAGLEKGSAAVFLSSATRTRFPDNGALIRDVFEHPRAEYYFLIFEAMDERLGPGAADRLLLQACLEAIAAKPGKTFRYFISRAARVYFWPAGAAVPKHDRYEDGSFGPTLTAQISRRGPYDRMSTLDYVIDRVLRLAMGVSVALVIATAFHALRGKHRAIWIVLMALATYLNATVILGNIPFFRYAYYAIPLHLICVLIGLAAVWESRRRAQQVIP